MVRFEFLCRANHDVSRDAYNKLNSSTIMLDDRSTVALICAQVVATHLPNCAGERTIDTVMRCLETVAEVNVLSGGGS